MEPSTTGPPWFEKAFGRHYLTVYAHRDDESAAEEAAFAIRALGLRPGARVLDLACGAGRHARALAARGMAVTGVDLSAELLEAAVARDGEGIAYVRADMRRLPFHGAFDAACQFFTSFGYFEAEEEDRRSLEEAATALRHDGRILLDYVNRDRVIESLVRESRQRIDGLEIVQTRRITPDGKRVEKRVRMEAEDGQVTEYTESVRLYPPDEVSSMLRRAGVEEEMRYGDLAGAPFSESSERLVIVGRRRC
ncbi:MAG: class I SAM-dependent methyltransferase [Planctomycetota bacterium]|jgi:SAM-dependent methyltransferase